MTVWVAGVRATRLHTAAPMDEVLEVPAKEVPMVWLTAGVLLIKLPKLNPPKGEGAVGKFPPKAGGGA